MADEVVSRILEMLAKSHELPKPKKIRELTVVEAGADPDAITHQVCNKCWDLLEIGAFPRVRSSSGWIPSRVCRRCHADRKADFYKTPKGRAASRANNAKRHADKLNRTPAWADLEAIKFFYECCPEGCHVDHIIPLRGENISGLHIETNLQWLPAEENLKKSNNFNGVSYLPNCDQGRRRGLDTRVCLRD